MVNFEFFEYFLQDEFNDKTTFELKSAFKPLAYETLTVLWLADFVTKRFAKFVAYKTNKFYKVTNLIHVTFSLRDSTQVDGNVMH